MLIHVNGVRLYVDVANPGLVPDGDGMREKPTLVMLHGGPGFDHTAFKTAFSGLGDVAQVVFYDHRGNGRSEGRDPATWNLAQWGDDVKGLCDALGVVKPIVCGLSFGGFVAQSYATRHPDHPGRLILLSTVAKIDFPTVFETFRRVGGEEVARIAESYWSRPTAEGRAEYLQRCVPFYRSRRDRPREPLRAIMNTEVALHFNGPQNEHGRFDFHRDLTKVTCPVLMMAGEDDPIAPVALAEAAARSMPPHLVRFERLAGCGHDIHGDDPERIFSTIRAFIAEDGRSRSASGEPVPARS